MKRLVVVGLAATLVVGALGMPAQAKKKKPKPPAGPAAVPTVLYMDGTTQMGEQETANVPVVRPASYLKLTAAAGSAEKSHGVPSYSLGPNNNCSGNYLFPVFVGPTAGTIKGDVKVTFVAESTPGGKVEVRIWPDQSGQLCNADYVEPAGKVVVDLPTSKGPVEAVIPGVDITAVGTIMIQITGVAGAVGPPPTPTIPPFYGRVYYGNDASKVEFSCTPAAGAATCVS